MGLPLSPILADILMEYFIDTAIFKLGYDLKAFIKYVDDMLLIVNKKFLLHMEDVLNSVHSKIQYNRDVEKDIVLTYLDVSIIHNPYGSIDFLVLKTHTVQQAATVPLKLSLDT